MTDKEFTFYMVSENEEYAPKGIRTKNEKAATETAKRLSEKYGKTFYVIEVCMVCNTVNIVGKADFRETLYGEWGSHGECPFCGYFRQWEEDNYCGNCGAMLVKESQGIVKDSQGGAND